MKVRLPLLKTISFDDDVVAVVEVEAEAMSAVPEPSQVIKAVEFAEEPAHEQQIDHQDAQQTDEPVVEITATQVANALVNKIIAEHKNTLVSNSKPSTPKSGRTTVEIVASNDGIRVHEIVPATSTDEELLSWDAAEALAVDVVQVFHITQFLNLIYFILIIKSRVMTAKTCSPLSYFYYNNYNNIIINNHVGLWCNCRLSHAIISFETFASFSAGRLTSPGSLVCTVEASKTMGHTQ
jgi:hypothetical protein